MYPIKVSENRRYFTDQEGVPVFWLGTTQWQLFREYTLEEARIILESCKARGFAFAQVILMGVGDGTKPNVYGEKPWHDDNPLTPNEAFFRNVDAVLRLACENNVVISMTLFHQRYRNYITVENGRAWAKWLAQRYRDVSHLLWSLTPEANAAFVPILRELAAGLREGDGDCRPCCDNGSTVVFDARCLGGRPADPGELASRSAGVRPRRPNSPIVAASPSPRQVERIETV